MTRRNVLTDEQVRKIREAHIPYMRGYETLAKEFGVAPSTIRDIITYRTRADAR